MLDPGSVPLSIITDDDRIKNMHKQQDTKTTEVLNLSSAVITLGKPPRAQSVSPRAENTDFSSSGARCYNSRRSTRMRSASAGRSPKNDLRSRYWAFLFDNLHRAVDEIYQTCEMDESIVECKEAILMLENYSKEFCSLAQWFKLSKELEGKTPPERPLSLSWEVRKSVPGKCIMRSAFVNYILSKPLPYKKGLDFCSFKRNVSASVQTDAVCVETSATVLPSTGLEKKTEKDNCLIAKENDNETEKILLETNSVHVDEDISVSKETTTLPNNQISVNHYCNEEQQHVNEQTKDVDSKEGETLNMPNDRVAENVDSTCESENVLILKNPLQLCAEKNKDLSSTVHVVAANSVEQTAKTNVTLEKKEPTNLVASTLRKVPSVHSVTREKKTVTDGPSTLQKDKKVLSEFANVVARDRKFDANRERRFNAKPSVASTQSLDYRKVSTATQPGFRVTHSRLRTTGTEAHKAATVYVPAKPSRAEQAKSSNKEDSLHKTESMSSVSSSSSGQSWADKVKGSLEVLQSKSLDNLKMSNEADDEGWETVHRGRTRGKNSPSKKLHPIAVSVGNLTQLSGTAKKSENFHNKSAETLKRGASSKVQSDLVRGPRTGIATKSTTVIRPRPVVSKRQDCDKEIVARNKPAIRSEEKHREEKSIKNAKNKIVSQNNAKIVPLEKISAVENKKELRSVQADMTSLSNDTKKLDHSSVVVNENEAISDKTLEAGKGTNGKPVVDDADKMTEVEMANGELTEEVTNGDVKNGETVEENIEKLEDQHALNEDDISASRDYGKLDYIMDCSALSSESISSGSDRDDDDNDDQEMENDWHDLLAIEAHLQEQVHELGLSWGDEMDRLDQELHRTPGRALQVHEKLSSPYKKRSPSETIRRHEEKLAKAREQRERLLEEKAQRCKNILKRAEEIRAWKEDQQQQKRLEMEKKLQRAEEKRRMQLQKIVRKAHDEEEKVNEIAFINTLEAQNKRHDILSKEKDREARLQDRQKEQLRRQEEKAAKEAAAEERRKVLEAERQARLLEMQEKRKIKDKKIEQQQQEKEKERQEIANQKARDREQRLSALNAAQQANLEELQKKIQQKQEDSARRHEENMESIRQKAFELSVRQCSSNNDDAPRLTPYETKKICTLCNVWIASEVYLLSHLRGKKHQEAVREQHQGEEPPTEELELYNIRHIVDAPSDKIDPEISLDRERQKALKKRCKKIRQRMINKGEAYEKTYAEKTSVVSPAQKQKFQKGIRDVEKSVATLGSGGWESGNLTALERALGELERVLEKSRAPDKEAFCSLGGIVLADRFLRLATNLKPDLVPTKSLVRICRVWQLACENSPGNCAHVLLGNQIIALLDLLVARLHGLLPPSGNIFPLPIDPLAGALMCLLAGVMTGLYSDDDDASDTDGRQRVLDVISYTVSVGIVDKLSRYLSTVCSSVDSEPRAAEFILHVVSFLTSLAKLLSNSRQCHLIEGKTLDDGTHLVTTFRVTELVGTISFLYGALLHSGAPAPPPELPPHTILLTTTVLRLLNSLAVLDLQMLQGVLSSEGLSLQLRHITSYLLGYCGHWNVHSLLHELVLLIGFFAVLHADNQVVIQSGQRPTVLQQLCSLPFAYFSDPPRMDVLFPTLVACCFRNDHNTAILEQELSPELLANYLEGSLLDVYRDTSDPRASKKDLMGDDVRWKLSSRFPKDKWTSAKQYFSVLHD